MSESSIGLKASDVVTVEKDKSPLKASTFRVSELATNLASRMNREKEFNGEVIHQWSVSGVGCQVLTSDGRGWRKGKVRFSLEFIPDPEIQKDEVEKAQNMDVSTVSTEVPQAKSPLDDLRAELNLDNQ